MSKKLVAGLIGWLILSLFLMSSVWAAVDKDKPKTETNKVSVNSALLNLAKTDMDAFRRAIGQKIITREERLQALEQAMKAEFSSSAYEAAAGIIDESPFFSPSVLTETAPQNFDTAGTSYYEINSNHRNPRQIAVIPANKNAAVAWAKSPTAALTARNVFGTLWVGDSKAGGNVFPEVLTNNVGRGGFCGVTYLPKTGKFVLYYHHATAPEGVFFCLEKVPGGFDWDNEVEVPDSFPGDADLGFWPTAAGGLVRDLDDYDNDANTTESLDVVHFFMNEGNTAGGSVDHYTYTRGVDSAGTLIFPGFPTAVVPLVDTGVNISPTVVASKISAKVALIYTAEKFCNYDPVDCSDLFFIESTNGGENWADAPVNYNFFHGSIVRNNVTNFDSSSNSRVPGDFMGVYDDDDNLVIAYCRAISYDVLTGAESAENDIYVWTAAFGNRKAVDGNFADMADQAPNASIPQAGFRRTVNFPHIAVHDGSSNAGRTNYLYLTWTQYGGNTSTEWGDTNKDAILNGDVWVNASTNDGKTWSTPVNMTASHTPACAQPVANSGVGTCSGIMYSSAAEWAGDDTIHMAYMTDEYSGFSAPTGTDHPNTFATNNEIIYMKYPAFTPTPEKRISVSQDNFIQNPSSILTDTFFVQNIGNDNLTVDSIENDSGWLVLTDSDTAGFTIPEGDPDRAIVFTVNDAGKPDGVYFDTVIVYNNSANKPQVPIEVIMLVDNTNAFVAVSFTTLNNGTQLLSVSNTGNLGNGSDTAGFYQKLGTDTTSMLFDGTTFIVMRNGTGDTVLGQHMHSQDALQALLPVHIKADSALGSPKTYITSANDTVTIPTGSYDYARAKFTTFLPDVLGVPYPGAWYGIVVEEELWWFPTPTNALVMIQKISRESPPSWWPDVDKGTDAFTAYIGHGIDFDAVADTTPASLGTSASNFGRQVPGYGLLWQEGVDPSSNYQIDSLVDPNGHFTALMNLGNGSTIDPPAMHIVSNQHSLYPGEGFVADTLYRLAGDGSVDTADFYTTGANPGKQFKYFATDSSEHDSLPVDLSSVMTMWALAGGDATVRTTAAAAFAIVDTSTNGGNTGCFKMTSNYQKLRQILGLDSVATKSVHVAAACSTEACAAKPGDANASGTYTLGDIIATVNYIFNKPGCTPLPLCWLSGLLCRGDWNGSSSVTLGDAIQGVNYIFSKPGGPWFPVASGVCCTPYNQ